MDCSTRSSVKRCGKIDVASEAHLKLVPVHKAGERFGTKARYATRDHQPVSKSRKAGESGSVPTRVQLRSRSISQKTTKAAVSQAGQKRNGEGYSDDGNDEDEDDVECDDEDEDDDDDDETKKNRVDVEEKANNELAEFYDLLKNTAQEDVKRIDAQLRGRNTPAIAPPKGLKTLAAKKVWDMAKLLTAVTETTVRIGKKLQFFVASQKPWGKCVLATEIAGELLREHLAQLKSDDDAQRKRARRKTTRRQSAQSIVAASDEDAAIYFAKRLAHLVDDKGRVLKEVSVDEAKMKAFFSRELKQAYVNLTMQIRASNAMAQRSGEVAFQLDGEVKASGVTTEDSLTRYGVAMKSAYGLYPHTVGNGKLSGCEFNYATFRKYVKAFLNVYKEFFVQGEVVYEKIREDIGRYYVLKLDSGYGYQIRGWYQGLTRERHYEYWSEQLYPLEKMTELNKRVNNSRKARVRMKQAQAERQSGQRKATAAKTKGKKTSHGPIKKSVTAPSTNAISSAEKRSNSGSRCGRQTRSGGCSLSGSSSDARGGGNAQSDQSSAKTTDKSSTKTAPCCEGGGIVSTPASAEVEQDEASDSLQTRNSLFDYVLLEEAPLNGFLSIVMMKPNRKPSEKTMKEELQHEEAQDNVDKFVSVATGGGTQYIDVCTLTTFLHGGQKTEDRNFCRNEAESRGLVTLSVSGGSSYLSKEVNVLYPETPEYKRLMGNFKWDVGSAVQFMVQYVDSGDYTADTVEHRIISRGNIQCTIGISDRNYDKAKPAEAGEVAFVDVQNEPQLHKYFPNRGREMGLALQKLAQIRDALAKDRDGPEYNDCVRNQVFSGRTGQMFGLSTVGFENASISLTGHSRTLEVMVEKLLKKLSPSSRAAAKARYDGTSVETEDHTDSLNPKEPEYSRVVLGKWRIHLLSDRKDDYLVVTLIGNHRSSVATYQTKMRGINGLGAWIREKFEARAEERGHVEYNADGDFLASGGYALRVGFIDTETNCIDKKTMDKGPGCFVSYSRHLSSTGSWHRHRKTILQTLVKKEKDANSKNKGKKRKRADASDDEDDPENLEKEMIMLAKKSTLYGELRMKRADFNRCADLSGCVWGVEELRDRFKLRKAQARQLALCIFWHAKSRAIFLIKCQALLQEGQWAEKFKKEVEQEKLRGKAGAVGSFIMNMVDSNRMGRMSSVLIRAMQLNINWDPEKEEGFTPEFVADQCDKLKNFLNAAENLKTVTTTEFLNKNLGLLRHIRHFVLPQVLPVCYMLALTNCKSRRAAEAPILDTKKKQHYTEFLRQGVDPKYFDLSVMVVALQFATSPLTIENTGCEDVRTQDNVHDFMLVGQMFYDLRPVPDCNYRNPEFEVWMKKWGAEGVWRKAVRERGTGRFRYPANTDESRVDM